MMASRSARCGVTRRARLGLALALTLAAGYSLGCVMAPGRAAPPPASPAARALVVDAAQKLGVKRCLPAITAIGQRAVLGATQQDIMVDWDRQAPDAAPFFSFIGLSAGKQRAGVTLVAVPAGTGGCAILVERVSSTGRPCAAVASSELPNCPATPLIDGITVYQNPSSPGETYVLVSNDGGCLILRRQSSFKWPPRP